MKQPSRILRGLALAEASWPVNGGQRDLGDLHRLHDRGWRRLGEGGCRTAGGVVLGNRRQIWGRRAPLAQSRHSTTDWLRQRASCWPTCELALLFGPSRLNKMSRGPEDPKVAVMMCFCSGSWQPFMEHSPGSDQLAMLSVPVPGLRPAQSCFSCFSSCFSCLSA